MIGRNYARDDCGGARPVPPTVRAGGREKPELGAKGHSSSVGVKELEKDAKNGWLRHFPEECLSVLFWEMLRLEGDSSISARIVRRSSVAEMMGKRRTSTQARENRHCRVVSLRPVAASLASCQSQ
jgi:hypothetical protein